MDYSFIAIMAVVIMACIGIVFGFILASADKKFAMEENPLIGEVKEALPQGQCGACGFAGCAKYAEAVVLDPNVPPNLCVPGKAEVAAVVAKLTGKVAEATEPKYAHIKCRGGNGIAKLAYEYKGIHDCAAAKIVQQGPKFCKFGCLGFGNCTRACPFGAMSMGENGLVHNGKLIPWQLVRAWDYEDTKKRYEVYYTIESTNPKKPDKYSTIEIDYDPANKEQVKKFLQVNLARKYTRMKRK